jgi:hypothetical protein
MKNMVYITVGLIAAAVLISGVFQFLSELTEDFWLGFITGITPGGILGILAAHKMEDRSKK